MSTCQAMALLQLWRWRILLSSRRLLSRLSRGVNACMHSGHCCCQQMWSKSHEDQQNLVVTASQRIGIAVFLHIAPASSAMLGAYSSRGKHVFELSLAMKSAGTDGRNCRDRTAHEYGQQVLVIEAIAPRGLPSRLLCCRLHSSKTATLASMQRCFSCKTAAGRRLPVRLCSFQE